MFRHLCRSAGLESEEVFADLDARIVHERVSEPLSSSSGELLCHECLRLRMVEPVGPASFPDMLSFAELRYT